MRKGIFAIIILFVFGLSSCIKGPNYPDEPVLTYVGMNKNTIQQSSTGQDTIEIYVDFTDGDGDIGNTTNRSRIFLVDTRLDMVQDSLTPPTIPIKGTKNGVDGRFTVRYMSTCCIFPDGTPPCQPNSDYPKDSLTLKIYMNDDAGNISNTVETDQIYLLCD